MKSPRTSEMEQSLLAFQKKIQNEREDTINGLIPFELLGSSYEEQWVTLSFPVTRRVINHKGILHGGILCSMVDTACGMLSVYLSGNEFTPTINLSVNFLRPMGQGDFALVTARATHAGKTINSLVAEVHSKQTGKLCATATASFFSGRMENR